MTLHLQNYEQSIYFVGRETELRKVVALVSDKRCHLLTLVGVGGVGKTQLALRSVCELQDTFADGVYFVDLQPITSRGALISSICDALGLQLSSSERPSEQLLQFLKRKNLLLVLDNFEQLIEYSALLSRIIRPSPDIKLLVTSREALNLHEEWLYSVQGLAVPQSHQIRELTACPSVQLFVERAQRVRHDFSLADQRAGVVRICQLVEGMPLAIEMAASWVKTLRCATIAAEIQQNLSFLRSNLRNVQERHQSMQAVFAQTWARLAENEQMLFKKLSVFRGGFEREAAESVAGASLAHLTTLLDKCLLRRDTNGRYHIHELLRQYAEARLAAEEATRVSEAHCHYFANFLSERKRGLNEKEQLKTSAEIERELENIRVAWQYAVDHEDVAALKQAAAPYFYYCQIRSRFLESARASEQAASVLDALGEQRLLAQVLVYWSWMLIRIGRFEKASAVLERSQSLFERLSLAPTYGMGSHPFSPLVILKGIQGEYTGAIALGEQLKQESAARDDPHNLSFACYGLTSAYRSIGQYEAARQNAEQAVEVAEEIGNHWFMAYCLIEWGQVSYANGNYAEARSHYRASLRLREAFDDPEGIAVVSVHLGKIALAQQDYQKASALYQRSLSIYQDLNDKGGLATTHQGFGRVAAQTGQPKKAVRHLCTALTIASEIQFLPLLLTILLDVADILIQNNQHQLAIQILDTVAQHPASDAQHQERVEELRAGLPTQEETSSTDLVSMLGHLQVALEEFEPVSLQVDEQPLVEPLTPRELEVLQHIAAGMTNREIAAELVIAAGTVKAHTSSIYGKLAVSNRAAAVSKAGELGLLS